jgi:hypothetical protein
MKQLNLHVTPYSLSMYGERLQQAMDARSDTLGQQVTRKEVARVAGVTVQNIGMVINDAKGRDQNLGTASHTAVAAYLRVNSQWLLTGEGPMIATHAIKAPSELSPAAIELAALFDMIPAADKMRRAKAFNAASTALMQALQS